MATSKIDVSTLGTIAEVCAALATGQIEQGAAAKRLSELTAKAPGKVYCKVSAKGGVSLYGINSQFPVTLYAEQWERMEGIVRDTVLPFIKAEEGKEHQAKEYVDGKDTGKMVKCKIGRKGAAAAAA